VVPVFANNAVLGLIERPELQKMRIHIMAAGVVAKNAKGDID
jgi:hypothetical protein